MIDFVVPVVLMAFLFSVIMAVKYKRQHDRDRKAWAKEVDRIVVLERTLEQAMITAHISVHSNTEEQAEALTSIERLVREVL